METRNLGFTVNLTTTFSFIAQLPMSLNSTPLQHISSLPSSPIAQVFFSHCLFPTVQYAQGPPAVLQVAKVSFN